MLIRTNRLQNPEGEVSGGGASTAAAPAASTPVPSPAPATSSPATESPASSSGSSEGTPVDAFDFGALVDNHNNPDDDTRTAVAPAVTPPAPAPAQAPAVAAPVVAPVAPVTPPTQPAGQPPAPASAEPTATAAPAAEPFDVGKHREAFLPKLAELYKLTDQEVADIQTNPGEAMPKLAAKLHYEVQLAVHQGMLQILPHLMGNYMESERSRNKNEEAFYTRWPELKEAVGKDPKNEANIQEAIRSFKTLNPRATLGDVIEKAGLLAMISMGIPPRVAQAIQQGQIPAPVATPAPVPIPGRPAGTGAMGHVQAPRNPSAEQAGSDLWSSLADHHLSGGG